MKELLYRHEQITSLDKDRNLLVLSMFDYLKISPGTMITPDYYPWSAWDFLLTWEGESVYLVWLMEES